LGKNQNFASPKTFDLLWLCLFALEFKVIKVVVCLFICTLNFSNTRKWERITP